MSLTSEYITFGYSTSSNLIGASTKRPIYAKYNENLIGIYSKSITYKDNTAFTYFTDVCSAGPD